MIERAPSAWVMRWAHLIRRRGSVLDLACGSGRHFNWLAVEGFRVTGVDRDTAAMEALEGEGDMIVADLEAGPWPLEGQQFDAVVVTNYLWRPLLPRIVASLGDGGVLIYETFADGQQTIGKPSRPEFLLQPGELLRACAGLRVVAFEDGFESHPTRFVQRIVAVSASAGAVRYGLDRASGAPRAESLPARS